MDEPIELTKPDLVVMGPQERLEGVGLLAALIAADSTVRAVRRRRAGTSSRGRTTGCRLLVARAAIGLSPDRR